MHQKPPHNWGTLERSKGAGKGRSVRTRSAACTRDGLGSTPRRWALAVGTLGGVQRCARKGGPQELPDRDGRLGCEPPKKKNKKGGFQCRVLSHTKQHPHCSCRTARARTRASLAGRFRIIHDRECEALRSFPLLAPLSLSPGIAIFASGETAQPGTTAPQQRGEDALRTSDAAPIACCMHHAAPGRSNCGVELHVE